MKLVVGLGNPGNIYTNTRHNSGFLAIDYFSDISRIDIDKKICKGIMGKGKIFNEDVILFKPLTFMNLSGEAVSEIVNFFKIDLNDIIIIYDDMALSPGNIRLRLSGSSGGQKGMQNIIDFLKTSDIKRIRIGIGEPTFNSVDYVLGKPAGEEKELWLEGIDKSVKALKEIFLSSFNKAMSIYNNK